VLSFIWPRTRLFVYVGGREERRGKKRRKPDLPQAAQIISRVRVGRSETGNGNNEKKKRGKKERKKKDGIETSTCDHTLIVPSCLAWGGRIGTSTRATRGGKRKKEKKKGKKRRLQDQSPRFFAAQRDSKFLWLVLRAKREGERKGEQGLLPISLVVRGEFQSQRRKLLVVVGIV